MFNFFHEIDVEAHCDIPCGIYEPTRAKIAAKTIARMCQQIQELKAPELADDLVAVLNFSNMISRRIAVKEEHAEICKHELTILWADFFKPEHLEQFPELHTMFWRALKLCSKNKQEVNPDAAADLVKAVDEIAVMFYKAKKTPERYEAYQTITDNVY